MRKKEAGAKVYDAGYTKGGYKKSYFKHYLDSPYFQYWKYILDNALVVSDDSVFEIGCGPGQFAHMLRDNGVTKYCGIDFSKVAIKQAQERVPDFEFICANAYTFDAPADIDVIVSLEVLEHMDKDVALIRNLPKGKRFVFSVPNFDSKNHVRYFSNALEIVDRYSNYCSITDVKPIQSKRKNRCLFIFHGTT